MRRIILMAVASGALAAPSVALASRHDEQHRHELTGTVASFTGGRLAITLHDGTTVSAKVTAGTEIECHAAIAAETRDGGQSGGDRGDGGQGDRGDDRGDGGQSGPGPGGSRQDENREGDRRDDDGRDEDGRDGDRRDDGVEDEAEHCPATALVVGAVVREADLNVGGAGAIWRKIELSPGDDPRKV